MYMGLMILGKQKCTHFRQTEIHAAEPQILELSAFEFEIATAKLIRHKLPGTDPIPEELMKAGLEKIALRSTNLLILFGKRRTCLRSGRNRSLYLPIRGAIKQMVVMIGAYHVFQLRTQFFPTSCSQS
jgi:hypothetical protein